MWYVYLLKCYDGKHYTYIAFNNKYKAYDFEKYLKSGSGRAFAKKRLI